MNGKTHTAVAISVIASVSVLYFPEVKLTEFTLYPLIGLATAPAGATIVDADMENSTAGRKYPLIAKVCTHRGITHTAVAVLVQYYLLRFTAQLEQGFLANCVLSAMFGFILSYFLHELADMLNGKGIPLFWPICRKKIHLADIPMGSGEYLFLIVVVVLCIVHVYGVLQGIVL